MKTIQAPDLQAELAIYCEEDSLGNSEEISIPIDKEMLSLIEAITGWVVEFEESRGSQLKRLKAIRSQAVANLKQTGHGPLIDIPKPEGQLVITDMSADWAAGRPTSHRGKCDRFVALLSELVSSRQQLELEGQRFRIALASLQSQIKSLKPCDDEIVADSFIPRHRYHTCSELIPEFELNESAYSPDDDPFSEFTASKNNNDSNQNGLARTPRNCHTQSYHSIPTVVDSNPSLVEFEFDSTSKQGCQIGGCRGFYGNRYVDWRIREDQRIELILGQIETLDASEDSAENCEWESKLILNPETNKYWLSIKPKGDFWLYDRQSQTLDQIESSEAIWQLKPTQSIVLTTSHRIRTASRHCDGFQHISSATEQGADGIAQAMQQWLQTDEPVLVLRPQLETD